jgi:sterol desaturase/sphingolipid hydroxylase (fatty acid hydroxylase superfamily)
MPTPIEVLLNPVSLVVFAMYASLAAWEAIAPARKLPQARRWRVRGVASFTVYFFLSTYLPLLWDTHLARYQLLDLSGLGTAGGTLVGLLVLEVGIYLWHRGLHGSDLLWRGLHQMHHSSERLDTFSAFYFSPLDIVGFAFLGSLCLTLGVGVSPQAATAILLLTTFFALFTHANVSTPRWLGYIVQRPEMHALHHGRGIHRNNFCDLPFIDLLGGTLRNPRTFQGETGFYNGASERVADMLLFRDVSEPRQAHAASQPRSAQVVIDGPTLP